MKAFCLSHNHKKKLLLVHQACIGKFWHPSTHSKTDSIENKVQTLTRVTITLINANGKGKLVGYAEYLGFVLNY